MGERRCVIVGDVVESRSVDDREALRSSLSEGLTRANEVLKDQIAAPFAVLKGVDEIGGVLTGPGRAYRALREIAEALHPVEIRFAVVHDEIDVGIGTSAVAEMDGPAFHEADRLLEHIASDDRAVALGDPDVQPWLLSLLEDQMHLLFTRKGAWTDYQAELVRGYRQKNNMQTLADELGVSVQTVSQTLSRANAESVIAIESNLETAMSEVWECSE